MKIYDIAFCIGFVMTSTSTFADNCPPLLDYDVQRLHSQKSEHLCELARDRVILVVNTASRCIFTSQYEGLEALQQKYKDRGLLVLGFPSNDFGNQEPDGEQKIAKFCRVNYGVTFPMFEKLRVKGQSAHPFFKHLSDASGRSPVWNFHKYLIDRKGNVVDNFASWTSPSSRKLEKAILALL